MQPLFLKFFPSMTCSIPIKIERADKEDNFHPFLRFQSIENIVQPFHLNRPHASRICCICWLGILECPSVHYNEYNAPDNLHPI